MSHDLGHLLDHGEVIVVGEDVGEGFAVASVLSVITGHRSNHHSEVHADEVVDDLHDEVAHETNLAPAVEIHGEGLR